MPKFTLTVSAADFSEYKEAVLEANPIPLDDDGQPTMTEDEWFQNLFVGFGQKLYERGRILLHGKRTPAVIKRRIVT